MDFQIIIEAFVLIIFRISKSVKQLYFFIVFLPTTSSLWQFCTSRQKKINLPAFRRFPMQAVTPHLLISKNVGILVTQGERIAWNYPKIFLIDVSLIGQVSSCIR
jgi:hypothetical protein